MKIWVDADALPGAVKEILVRAANRRGADITLVANRWMRDPKSPRVDVVTVSKGEDVADDYIAENCGPDELVITADIPLAARAVEAGAMVITPRGRELDEANVSEHLSFRDFSQELRDVGIQTGGPSSFGDTEKRDFASALDRWITRLERTSS